MANEYTQHTVTDEDRREFLKALGITGVAAGGGVTLSEVRNEVASGSTADLAPIGEAIKADLAGAIDAGFIAEQQASLTGAATELSAVPERDFPADEPRHEFGAVAEAERPVYDHFTEVGFFESTTEHLPEFHPEYLESTIATFAASEALAEPMVDLEFTGTAGVDLLAEVVANAEELSDYHWIATDEIPRHQLEIGEVIPPMTMGTAGGALLWLEDLDNHLWQHQVLLTDDIVEKMVWHGQSMAAGFHLVNEGARAIAIEDGSYTADELGALLSTGFMVLAIAQGLLPQDVYWITEEMRGERRTDLELIH